jgi:hypothetical protein
VMNEELENIIETYNDLDLTIRNIVFSIELLMSTNLAVKEINKTENGLALDFIRRTLHKNIIIDLNKVYEAYNGKDRKANIDYIVSFVETNKDYLADNAYDIFKKHYPDWDINRLEKISELERTNVYKEIEEILKLKEDAFKDKKEAELFKNGARHALAHSFETVKIAESIKGTSLKEVDRFLLKACDISAKLHFVLKNTRIINHYNSAKDFYKENSDNFWGYWGSTNNNESKVY